MNDMFQETETESDQIVDEKKKASIEQQSCVNEQSNIAISQVQEGTATLRRHIQRPS